MIITIVCIWTLHNQLAFTHTHIHLHIPTYISTLVCILNVYLLFTYSFSFGVALVQVSSYDKLLTSLGFELPTSGLENSLSYNSAMTPYLWIEKKSVYVVKILPSRSKVFFECLLTIFPQHFMNGQHSFNKWLFNVIGMNSHGLQKVNALWMFVKWALKTFINTGFTYGYIKQEQFWPSLLFVYEHSTPNWQRKTFEMFFECFLTIHGNIEKFGNVCWMFHDNIPKSITNIVNICWMLFEYLLNVCLNTLQSLEMFFECLLIICSNHS